MDEKIESIVHLIEQSPLDQTIKDILIRDLRNEGLNDFNKEQIKAYCLEGLKQLDEKIVAAKQYLDENKQQDPV